MVWFILVYDREEEARVNIAEDIEYVYSSGSEAVYLFILPLPRHHHCTFLSLHERIKKKGIIDFERTRRRWVSQSVRLYGNSNTAVRVLVPGIKTPLLVVVNCSLIRPSLRMFGRVTGMHFGYSILCRNCERKYVLLTTSLGRIMFLSANFSEEFDTIYPESS